MDFNNTIQIIEKAFQTHDTPLKEKVLDMLQILYTKINSVSGDNRPRQLEELLKRIDEANVGIIKRDRETGKIFYPVIADMLLFELKTMEYVETYLPILKPLANNIFEIKRNLNSLDIINDEGKKAIFYRAKCNSTKKQKHYLASLFSKELKIDYRHIKKLIEHLFYQVPNNAKLPHEPMDALPEPLIDPLQHIPSKHLL